MVQTVTFILVLQVFAIVIGSWFARTLVIRLITRVLKRAGTSPGLTRSVRDGLTILWIVLAVIGTLDFTGIAPPFSFLTISGIVGLAVSLALQNTLSNFISGILIVYDGGLRINDAIGYGGVQGVVVKIGLQTTWVRTADGKIAIISNNNLANGPLVNDSAGERLERKLRV